jgi:hypothetical protein
MHQQIQQNYLLKNEIKCRNKKTKSIKDLFRNIKKQ